jgi:hypothetical protein
VLIFQQFVLKLNARLATQLFRLNEIVRFASKQMEGSIILIEGSFERLLLIARRDDSVFTRKNVFPLMK